MTYPKALQHKNYLLRIKNAVGILTRVGSEVLISKGIVKRARSEELKSSGKFF